MVDDVPLTWALVAEKLKAKGRGAPYQLAKKLGMNTSYFYRKLKTGADLTERQAQIVRAFLADEETPAAPAPPLRQDRPRLNVYGYAAAGGEELVALANGEVIDTLELPLGLELGPGEWFVVRPIGSSMEPRIFAGEDLVVRRGLPPRRGKEVVVEFTDGTGVVKTYQGQRDGRVWVEQYNPPKVVDYDASRVRALHAVALKL